MTKEEWINRCGKQFDLRVQDDKATWKDAAVACYDNMYEDFQDSPEDAADEEMSNWDDDT